MTDKTIIVKNSLDKALSSKADSHKSVPDQPNRVDNSKAAAHLARKHFAGLMCPPMGSRQAEFARPSRSENHH